MTTMLQRFFLLLCLLGATFSVAAKPVFVSDSLYIGLHQDNTLSSTIIELIPSGTELELLAREGNLYQVRTLTGITGWVDSSFITEQAPARAPDRAQTADLEARLQAGTDRIAELQEQLTQAEQRARDAADQAAQTADPPAPGQTPIPTETLREMQKLAEENQRMKQQVVDLEAMQAMAVERAQAAELARQKAMENSSMAMTGNTQAPASDNFVRSLALKYWQQLLLGSVLLLAFAMGGWLVDLSVRRRHGGHRL